MWDQKYLDRKRKTKIPCEGCGLRESLCICAELPLLDLATRLTLVIHRRETQKTTNTGMLATRVLKNSKMIIRGEINKPTNMSICDLPEYENLLLYPSEDAEILTPDFIASFIKPVHLIVPDGSWRQASKVHYRHNEIKHLKRVVVPKSNFSMDRIRKESKEGGMATLHAIAIAMEILEGEQVGDAIFSAFEKKLEGIMVARGKG
ncbi:MAG: tRNA-uridine aminocarboxypropyltransferase [Bdellovibrionales bacterium]